MPTLLLSHLLAFEQLTEKVRSELHDNLSSSKAAIERFKACARFLAMAYFIAIVALVVC